jgi:Cu2+-exporting ATPase
MNSANEPCFHCGLPVPPGSDYKVVIDGEAQPMCCPGCQAVAQAIVDNGLTDFYRYRTTNAPTARDVVPDELRKLDVYDRPELQRRFVASDGEHIKSASLILEGIVCAACVWLNERHVMQLPGVVSFQVNYSTHRAQLKWDDSQIKLSDILRAIADIGYRAHPYDPERQAALNKKERAQALKRLAVAGLGAMQVMMLAVAMYAGDYSGMDPQLEQFMRWVSFLIATPVVFYAARPFFTAAWRDMRRRQLGMDVPVALAIGSAYLASGWATVTQSGEVYFDSLTMFTFFLLTGRFLEMGARQRAGEAAEELLKLVPAMATRIGREGDEVVPVAELAPGDRVRIKPGEPVPADGTIVEGRSSVDESLLTGESMPVGKHPGETLVGGSVNVESPLILEVRKVGQDTVLAAIQRLLDRAQSEKPQLARLADRVASYFVGALLLIAVGVGLAWWQLDAARAFWVVLSVLVVTCPCALSLATPAALTAATGALTRRGILITRGHALETLSRVTTVLFDKTGTLSEGQLHLLRCEPLTEQGEHEMLRLAAALEMHSEHPIAGVFRDHADPVLSAHKVQATPGEGVEGVVEGHRYRIGRPAFVGALAKAGPVDPPSDSSATCIWLGDEQRVLAAFYIGDQLRADAPRAVAEIQRRGIKVLILSGDQAGVVNQVAQTLGIDHADAQLRPEDKLDRVRSLQQAGEVVAMVGDGVNDAPVLAAADVSVAMGQGTQLAQASADMVLLSERLRRLPEAIEMGRRSMQIVRQNLGWAILYNIVAVPLAALGYVAPWMAAIGMSASSLLVVLNALRLRQDDEHPRPADERPLAKSSGGQRVSQSGSGAL